MVLSHTKSLLIVTAIAELGAGVVLLLVPSLALEILSGAGLESPASVLLGRIAGAALFSISLCCWLERNRPLGQPSMGLVLALAVYNAAVAVLLIYAAAVDGMKGVGIWPAIGFHLALLIWCLACLRTVKLTRDGKIPIKNSFRKDCTK